MIKPRNLPLLDHTVFNIVIEPDETVRANRENLGEVFLYVPVEAFDTLSLEP